MKLVNAAGMKEMQTKDLPRLDQGRRTDIPMSPSNPTKRKACVAICDEDDLNITSTDRDKGKIEKLVRDVRACAYVSPYPNP